VNRGVGKEGVPFLKKRTKKLLSVTGGTEPAIFGPAASGSN
jgi:hypothetical protein